MLSSITICIILSAICVAARNSAASDAAKPKDKKHASTMSAANVEGDSELSFYQILKSYYLSLKPVSMHRRLALLKSLNALACILTFCVSFRLRFQSSEILSATDNEEQGMFEMRILILNRCLHCV